MKKNILLLSLISILFLGMVFSGFSQNNVSVLEFDGNDSYYVNDSGDKLDVLNSDWTIETWVYPTKVPSSNTYPAIISRKYSFELYFRNTNGDLGFGIIDFNSSGFGIQKAINSGTTSMTLNVWHHIAVSSEVSGSRTTRLFIDGNLIYSYTSSSDFNLDNSIAAMNFGARCTQTNPNTYDKYIDDCAMDEIRYSKTARYTSDFTITTHTQPHTTDANTILLYHLDENGGTSIANDNDSDFDTSLRSGSNAATWRAWDYYPVDLPLPIELMAFSAELKNYCVKLNWQTTSETNNKGFEIQKSNDAKSWKKIGFVEGFGNSGEVKDYTFTDKYPYRLNYYRLKQIDFNDGFSFSKIRSIAFNTGREITIFPIPANDVINISGLEPDDMRKITIFNGQGVILKRIETGSNEIDIQSLNSGVYYLRIEDGNTTTIKRFIK